MPELRLSGCTPEPMMGYLKALGVFRLVAEQIDPQAAMWWRDGVCRLESTLDRDAVVDFFLEKYQPTPVLTPWNSASGFAPTKAGNKAPKDKTAREAAEAIAKSSGPQLEPYRSAIHAIRQPTTRMRPALPPACLPYRSTIRAIRKTPRGKEDEKDWKQSYFARCRAVLAESVVTWLDTCFALTNDSLSSFPLLGTGGNDGVSDFGGQFMQRVRDVLLPDPSQGPTTSREYLKTSLFNGWLADDAPSRGRPPSLMSDTVGQFHPGGVGGANATQKGFERESLVNPWDFVLMIEGAMLFAGSVARRFGASASSRAVFPFTVDTVAVGYGSATATEETTDGSRAELWLPLWDRPTRFDEVAHLFAEGRAQVGRRQARNSVEFALAVNLLGVNRGVGSFARYGFLKRNGLAYLATPLGRMRVTPRPEARLLDDEALVKWLDRFRSACRDKDKTPARFQSALRGIDRAVFEFAARDETVSASDRKGLIQVLRALGDAERVLSRGLAFCTKHGVKPLQNLSARWLDQANDSSAEFRLAASVAGVPAHEKLGPIRTFLETVKREGGAYQWPSDKNTSAVWSNRPLAGNLAALFRRRQMEAFREGKLRHFLDSPRPALIADVLAFLRGETDDDKLADLLWALIAIDWSKVESRTSSERLDDEIPFEFGLPRLLVEPRTIAPAGSRWTVSSADEPNVETDPQVFQIMASGQGDSVKRCVDHAARRLKSSGLLVHGYRNRGRSGKSLDFDSPTRADRLLASMLFPLTDPDLGTLANVVLFPPEPEN